MNEPLATIGEFRKVHQRFMLSKVHLPLEKERGRLVAMSISA
jgi:hypothetical protein